ncbi:hypothetical protein [Actinacidiphila acidipaludis]|nr:hypothetical protein [Streptomyces acidipaludis]
MASPAPAGSVRAGAGLRLLRAAVFTAVCVVLAAAGHTLASGRSVPPGSLALGWLAVFAVAAPLAGRERRMPSIAGVLAAGQLALHAVFNAGQVCAASGAPAAAVAGAPGTSGAAGASGASLEQGAHGAAAMPGMGAAEAMAHSLCSLPMVVGHVLAAVVAGWILRRGEAALWRLARGASGLALLLRRAFALLSVLVTAVPSPGVSRPVPATTARHRTVWLRHTVARRGPPRVVLAA